MKIEKNKTELLFLGTGAADWTMASEDGEYRSYSSLLIDGEIIIDFTFEGLDMLKKLDIDLSNIKDIFITHSHSDHFDLEAIQALNDLRRQESIKKSKDFIPLNIYLEESWMSKLSFEGLSVNPLKIGEGIKIRDFFVLPLASNHRGGFEDETAFFYLFKDDKKSWLYGTDGAWFLNDTWEALKEYKLSLWITDATIGDGNEGDYRIFEHNSLDMIRLMAASLYKNGVLEEGADIILTHLAKTLHPGQEDLELSLDKPYLVAYDGFKYLF